MKHHIWQINCEHTPEMIDRLMSPLRKRGLCVQDLHYRQIDPQRAGCRMAFEADEKDAERIFRNMIRITGVEEISRDPIY